MFLNIMDLEYIHKVILADHTERCKKLLWLV